VKRSLVAVLALSLALGGCGGSDGKKSTASSSTAATPPPAASSAPSGSSGAASGASKGTGAVPTAPGGSGTAEAAQKFNDCVRRHGVTMPSPHPSSTPSKAELAKIRAALQACVKAMSGTPAATPK
jgi:hypothetical protein